LTEPSNKLPTNPQRVEAFANFFKRYMSVSTVVTAALPIPVTAFKLIPTLPFQTQELSVYAPLFCFLVLAFIFYSRPTLARLMFQSNLADPDEPYRRGREMLVGSLPLVLIGVAFAAVMWYRYLLIGVVQKAGSPGTLALADSTPDQVSDIAQIHLMAAYLAIFIAAEAAFVLMAIKEYLQDYLGLEDRDLITPPMSVMKSTPPSVTRTIPEDRSINVPPDIHPTVAFSKNMHPETITPNTFTLIDLDTFAEVQPIGPDGIFYDIDTREATFTPADPLVNGRMYQATISAKVRDQQGVRLEESYVWHFHTTGEGE
jgi:hypothetical protein